MKNDVLKLIAQKAKRRLIGRENISSPKVKIMPDNDENFKDKVEFLLSQEGVISNPVKYLIDEKSLKGLSEEGRERYLLSTLDKYNSLRKEIESISAYGRNAI